MIVATYDALPAQCIVLFDIST